MEGKNVARQTQDQRAAAILAHVMMTDDDIETLSHLNVLRGLQFVPGTTFPPHSFVRLARLRWLQFLTFEASVFSRQDMQDLGSITTLRSLIFLNCQFGDVEFQHLTAPSRLERVQQLYYQCSTFSVVLSICVRRTDVYIWLETSKHAIPRRDVYVSFAIPCITGIFFAQGAIATKPRKCSLNNPPPWQYHKCMLIRKFLHNFQFNIIQSLNICGNSAISTVNPNMLQCWIFFRCAINNVETSCLFGYIGSMNDNMEEIATRVNQNVAFTPHYLFFPHRSRVRRPILSSSWIDYQCIPPWGRDHGHR